MLNMTDEILNLLKSKEKELVRLGKKISDAEASLAKLRQSHAVVEGEKNAFAQAAKLMGHSIITGENSESSLSPSIERLDEDWVSILHCIYKRNLSQFGYDDVMSAGEIVGKELKKPSVRTQVMSYVKSGVLERIVDGKFRFSDPIATELKNHKRKEKTPDDETSGVNSFGVSDGSREQASYPHPESSILSDSTVSNQQHPQKQMRSFGDVDDEIPF